MKPLILSVALSAGLGAVSATQVSTAVGANWRPTITPVTAPSGANSAQPQIVGLLEQGRTTLDQGQDVLEALKNNPLLRGGVPDRREQQTTFQSYRDEEF